MITTEEIKEYWVKNIKKYDYYEVEYDSEFSCYRRENGLEENWVKPELFYQWHGHHKKLNIIIGGGYRVAMMPFGDTVFMIIRMGLSDGKYLAYSQVRDIDELKDLIRLSR